MAPRRNNYPFAIKDSINEMYFTSDTFGFSALYPRGNAWKGGNYPYARYLGANQEGKIVDRVKWC